MTFDEYKEKVKRDLGPTSKETIDFAFAQFGISEERYYTLIAHSGYTMKRIIDGHYENVLVPMIELNEIAQNKEEATFLLFNFGRTLGGFDNIRVEPIKQDNENSGGGT